MKKITIETPIVLMKIKGNHKKIASMLKTTEIATYEEHIDQTFIVVKVEDIDGIDLKVSEDYKEVLGLTEDDFVSRQFSKNGIDFIVK